MRTARAKSCSSRVNSQHCHACTHSIIINFHGSAIVRAPCNQCFSVVRRLAQERGEVIGPHSDGTRRIVPGIGLPLRRGGAQQLPASPCDGDGLGAGRARLIHHRLVGDARGTPVRTPAGRRDAKAVPAVRQRAAPAFAPAAFTDEAIVLIGAFHFASGAAAPCLTVQPRVPRSQTRLICTCTSQPTGVAGGSRGPTITFSERPRGGSRRSAASRSAQYSTHTP